MIFPVRCRLIVSQFRTRATITYLEAFSEIAQQMGSRIPLLTSGIVGWAVCCLFRRNKQQAPQA